MTKNWEPKTKIGRKVKNGEITSFEQIYKKGKPILEYQITEELLKKLEDETIDVMRVARVTDSGRKFSLNITVAVGDKNGHVAIGEEKGNEFGPTIEKAVENAKKNMKSIKRGCGSWECGCGENHSIPLTVTGKEGSVEIEIKPAPKGTGIVAGETAKKILKLAGIKDVWTKTKGTTRTNKNYAKATLKALQQTRQIRHREKE